MIKSHKIRLNPTKEQLPLFWQSSSAGRIAYNWGLARWKELYEAGEKPSAYSIKKEFNAIKREQFPWMYEVSGRCTEYAFTCLGAAFKNFFAGRAKYPKFKSKYGVPKSFYAANTGLKFDGYQVRLPKIGWVNMCEPLRFTGKVMSGIISHRAGWWFLSVVVDVPTSDELPELSGAVGVDLGIKELAVTSDGDVFANIHALRTSEKKLAKVQRKLARQKKGSKRRKLTKLKIGRLHYRIANQRNHAIHQLTNFLTDNYQFIGLEDLNAKGMVKNRKLAKSVSDASFGEIKRQLIYKSDSNGNMLQLVDRWYPSTKTCSQCGNVKDMLLSMRIYDCENCGLKLDRDLNAAINIRNEAMRMAGIN